MLQIIWLVLADTMWPGRAKFWPWWYQIKKNVLTRAVSFNSSKQFCEVCIVAEPSRKDKMMIVRSNRWHKFSSALQLTIRTSSPRALWQEVDGIKDFLLGGCLDLGFVEPEVEDRVHYNHDHDYDQDHGHDYDYGHWSSHCDHSLAQTPITSTFREATLQNISRSMFQWVRSKCRLAEWVVLPLRHLRRFRTLQWQ